MPTLNPRAILFLIVCAGLAGAYFLGRTHGADHVQQAWNNETVRRERELQTVRELADKASAEHELEASKLRRQLAEGQRKLRASLQGTFTCPASGKLSDIVLPAAVVDSLFIRAKASVTASAASEPDR